MVRRARWPGGLEVVPVFGRRRTGAQVKVVAQVITEVMFRELTAASPQACAKCRQQHPQRAKLRDEFANGFLQGMRPCPVINVFHRSCYPGARRTGSYINEL